MTGISCVKICCVKAILSSHLPDGNIVLYNTGVVPSFLWRVFDMSAPVANSITSSASGTYIVNDVIQIVFTFDQVVNVVGSPSLECTIESGTIYFAYASGSGTEELTFSYTVQPGDNSNYQGINLYFEIVLNGATIRNAGLEDLVLTTFGCPGLQFVNMDGASNVCTLVGASSTLTVTKGAAFTYRLYSKIGGQYQSPVTWNPSVSVRASDPLAAIPIVPYLFNNTDASSTGYLFTGLVFNSVGQQTLTFIAPDPDGINVRYPVSVTVGVAATKITAAVVRTAGRTTQIALSATDASGDVDLTISSSITITSSAPAFVNVTATSDTESFVDGQALITVSSLTANTLTFAASGLTSATVAIA